MDAYRPPPSSLAPSGRPFGLRLHPLPHHGYNHSPLTPLSFLLRGALIYPDKAAVVHPERGWSLTYEQWAARCLSLAFAVMASDPNWKKGDRVAILTANSPMILDAYHGVLAVGGIVVPLNIRNTAEEIKYVLDHSGAKLLLVDHELTHLVPPKEHNKGRLVIVTNDSGGQDPSDAYEEFLAVGRRAWDDAQRREFQRCGNDDSARLDWELLDTVEETDTAALCYTSGTTGKPKGVLTNHRGCYLAAVANAIESKLDYDSVYAWTLPIFHACGWTFPWACTLSFSTQYIMRKVDPGLMWHSFDHAGVSHFCAAPTVLISLVNHPSAHRLPRTVRVMVAASAPTANLLGKLEQNNISPIHAYGLTESYGPLTRRYPSKAWAGLDVDARALLMARQGHGYSTAEEARVVRLKPDKDGSGKNVVVVSRDGKRLIDVKRDGSEIGEIALRGNIVMQGYYNDDSATAKTMAPPATSGSASWFLTGDLAVRHPGGEIEIRDRGKDIIISGGENVSSLMVEQGLAAHPQVMESCVVARPHAKWGERCHAFVVLTASARASGAQAPTEADLKAYCKGKMSGFAVPEWIEIVDELPKTSTGKVQKNVLRGRVSKL